MLTYAEKRAIIVECRDMNTGTFMFKEHLNLIPLIKVALGYLILWLVVIIITQIVWG